MAIVKKLADQEYVSAEITEKVNTAIDEFNCIIDVETLPTENIQNDSFYRYQGDIYVYSTEQSTVSEKLPTETRVAEMINTQIAAIPTPDVSGQINAHNTATVSHNDIRLLVEGLTTRLNTLADSDDTTLDQMSEIVNYIKSNKTLIEEVTTNKVNVTDIIDNLTTNVANKPLSAAQGVALKALIDAIDIPTNVSELTNDSGYLTSYTETDPTVPAWAKNATKPSYTASEVGALPSTTKIPSKTSDLTNDSGFITGYTETDPTVPSWAKQSTKPSYSKSEVGLGNVDNVKQYSASNPPPYPVTSVNGKTGAVTVSVPTKVSQLQNDSGFLTEISKEEIVQQVITALGTPVFGRVDADNNIILTGELADGVYTIKYEDKEGNVTEIGTLNHVPEPTYTNILPLAINSDKTPFVGTNGEEGYKTGYRLNSSGVEASASDWEVTGFIPITKQDVLYFKNIQWRGNSQKHDYISLYNSDFTTLTSTQVISVFIEQTLENAGSAPEDYGITLDADNNLVSIDFKKLSTTAYGSVSVAGWPNVKYIRFSCFGITDETIITKNEPITD